jgi:hypothetical protein
VNLIGKRSNGPEENLSTPRIAAAVSFDKEFAIIGLL